MISIIIYKDMPQGKLVVGEEMGKVKIRTTYKTLSQKKWGK